MNLLGHPVFSVFWLTQFLDVLFLTLITFAILRAIWNQPAKRVVIPVGVFLLVAMVLQRMHFHATGKLLEEVAKILPIALVVLFHEEIKDMLGDWGRNLQQRGFLNREKPGQRQDPFIETLVSTCSDLGLKKMGALFVIERDEDLTFFCNDYYSLPDIRFEPRLVEAMLTPPGPLHDGAIVIRDRKIIMAHAFLPLHLGIEGFGGRHRAALGITERTDAVAVLVSGETGALKLAVDGEITPSITEQALRRRLYNKFYPGMRGAGEKVERPEGQA